MKVWIIVLRADEDEAADGVTDELCSGLVFQRLDRAKKECERILVDEFATSEIPEENRGFVKDIDWAEMTQAQKPRRFLGRPRAEVDMTFELHQAEVV